MRNTCCTHTRDNGAFKNAVREAKEAAKRACEAAKTAECAAAAARESAACAEAAAERAECLAQDFYNAYGQGSCYSVPERCCD